MNKAMDCEDQVPYNDFDDNYSFYTKLLSAMEESFWGKHFPDEYFKYYAHMRDELLDINPSKEQFAHKIQNSRFRKKFKGIELVFGGILQDALVHGNRGSSTSKKQFLWNISVSQALLVPEGVYFLYHRLQRYFDEGFESVRFESMLQIGFEQLEIDFQKILKSHRNYIIVPPDEDQGFQEEMESIEQYIHSSLEEIQSNKSDTKVLTRRPRYAFLMLSRIYRELEYIRKTQKNLREKIAEWVKRTKGSKKQQRANITDSIETTVSIGDIKKRKIDEKKEKDMEYLSQCFIRIDNIKNALTKRNSRLSQMMYRGDEFLGELQIMKERLNIVCSQNRDLHEVCMYLSEKIQEIAGIRSARIEELTSNRVNNIMASHHTEHCEEGRMHEIEQELLCENNFVCSKTVRCIDTYISYLALVGSSTNDTKSESVGDGHTFYHVILPFLRYVINGLRSGQFQASSLSIATMFSEFKSNIGSNGFQYSSRILNAYQHCFLKYTQEGYVDQILPYFVSILEEISGIIQATNTRKKHGCVILIRRSNTFFESSQWKQLTRGIPRGISDKELTTPS